MAAAAGDAGDESLVFLGEAVLRLLRVLSPRAGCVLVLEDLHWADLETLALLEYLADNLSAERVLCVGTLRDEGGDAAALASALEARGSAAVLPLRRLDPAAMARMALACVGAADLPGAVQAVVAERAEGIPFLVEEVLAGLIGEGALTERDGRWRAADLAAAGVPATFADAVRRRLDAVDADSRHVLGAAAVLGRRFDWSLLSPVTGLADAAVVAALRRGVGLQLIVADRDSFRFRHALTHDAVLAGLLPPERALLAGQALAAVEAAHPGLPGASCLLAADLAERAGDPARAAALLLEAGRRDLAVGALASAEHTLTRAQAVTGGAPGCRAADSSVDEALTEVFAMSGQVDRAIEMGQTLLARLDRQVPSAGAALHLGIARAAIAGARWAEAAASIEVARESGADAAQADACAAQVAVGQGRLAEADELARAALRAAEDGGLPDVACEALEVIGRVARQRDLEAAERAFTRAADLASAHGLQLWRLRALHELGTIDQLRTESVDRLRAARELAVAQGALALTATLDLQIAAGLNKQFRADEALRGGPAVGGRGAPVPPGHAADGADLPGHRARDPRRGTGHGGQDRRGDRAGPRRPGRARLRLGSLPGHVLPAGGGPRRGARADGDRGRADPELPGHHRAAVPRAVAAAGRRCWTGTPTRPRPGSGPRTAPGTWWSRPCSVTPTPSWRAGAASRWRRRGVRRRGRADGTAGGLVPAVRPPDRRRGGARRRLG